jgi:hypothetical protein
VNRVRRPPLEHRLALVFDRAVDSLCASLSPDTTRHYRGTARNFLRYLDTEHPQLTSLDQPPWINCAANHTSLAGCLTSTRNHRRW